MCEKEASLRCLSEILIQIFMFVILLWVVI